MTKHSQGVFEPTEGFFSQITFPIHLMVGSPKEHSDDVVKHSDDAVMQEEQEQACSSKEHSDTVLQEQEQACLSKEHSDTQEQACSSKEHSDDAVIQEQALQLSREKQH